MHPDKYSEQLADNLGKVLDANKDKRVVVVGTPCTGKSTFLRYIKNAYDMDELIFPKLSKEERDYVCRTPWNEQIGEKMNKLVKESIMIERGKPVFGTVLLDSDMIVYLRISDYLLKERTSLRGDSYTDAKNMQAAIEREVKKSSVPCIDFLVG